MSSHISPVDVDRERALFVESEWLEIRCLLDAVFLKYGYDFRNYARASITRRIRKTVSAMGLDSISALQHELLYDVSVFERLLLDLSINVTEMFRDVSFFKAVRTKVLPMLASQELVRVWHAGCATGEEVFSMAILLQEAGLYDRSRLYATDLNEVVLDKARHGVYPLEDMKQFTINYQQAGGKRSFADYYHADDDSAILDRSLKQNVVFADHNLATDGVFGEMDLVVCRNVLIYFDRELQNRACGLFSNSLGSGGFLCLGSKESLRFFQCADEFDAFVKEERIYRKRSPTLTTDGQT